MYLIWFDLCALAILLVILFSYYTQDNIPILQNRIFIQMVFFSIVTTLCDFAIGIWQNGNHYNTDKRWFFLIGAVGCIYHILRISTAFLYAIYIIAVLNASESSRLQLVFLFVPISAAVIINLPVPIKGLAFIIDEQGIFHPGRMMPILYIIAFYYLFFIVYLIIYFRKEISLLERFTLHSFSFFAMGTVLIQRLFPTIMIEGIGTALCLLLIYLTIQQQGEVIDTNTNLLTRKAFFRFLAVQFRQKKEFDIIVITISNYQFLKKSLGWRILGRLTNQVAVFMRNLASKTDACRITEEMFCLVTRKWNSELTQSVMDKTEQRFKCSWDVLGQSILLPVNITKIHCPGEAESVDDVMNLLEHIHKNTSGENIESSIGTADKRTQEIERAIDEALKYKRFQVVYQPIYSIKHNRFISAEALIRLHDEKLGTIRPDEFIPIAEKSGAIIKIGKYVLETVCHMLAEHQLKEFGIEYIEINLSIVECLQEDLVENILEVLKKYHLGTEQVNFEITETAAEEYPETVHNNIHKLAEKGIHFSLDDYGTGYSNIGRILTMPLDIIKLDRSIVQAYFNSTKKGADVILAETLNMLQKLDKRVIAEGVETKEQADTLIQMGCEFIQGYYYAKPMSSEAFLEQLTAEKEVYQLPLTPQQTFS